MCEPGPAPMPGDKLRLRFSKRGALRLVSHLDLVRCLERLCRRAALPFKLTQGFHPAPRIIFGLALPLGAEGLHEVLEIEFHEPLDAQDVLDRMNAQSPQGLVFLNAYAIDLSTTAVVRRAIYTLELSEADVETARTNAVALMNHEKVWAPRLKPKPRQVNIKPYIRELIVDANTLILDFWVTPYGTARADEVIQLLGLPSPHDSGRTLARTDLELHDEVYAGLPDGPPGGPPELKPLNLSPGVSPRETEPATPAATWGLSPLGPAVE